MKRCASASWTTCSIFITASSASTRFRTATAESQDGNGRVGRLILFKECLRSGVVPFIITDELRMFYYRGLSEWERERGYLRDTCLTAQDRLKAWLDYFRISY